MPLYEYVCNGCDDAFTLLQSVNADPSETACPACGSGDVAKRFSAFAPSVKDGGGPAMPPCGMPGGGGCSGGMCGM